MLSKIIAGIAGLIVTVSACMVDSMNSTPIAVMIGGVILLGIAVMANPEAFA